MRNAECIRARARGKVVVKVDPIKSVVYYLLLIFTVVWLGREGRRSGETALLN